MYGIGGLMVLGFEILLYW